MENNLLIEPYFLHKDLCYSLLPKSSQKDLSFEIEALLQSRMSHNRMMMAIIYAEYMASYIIASKLPSLEQKIAKRSLKEGDIIWSQQTFQFKGTYAAARSFDEGIDPSYANLYSVSPVENKIVAKFNAKHMYTSSSVEMLSGRSKKYIFAYVQAIRNSEIELRPIIIGNCYFKDSSFRVPLESRAIIYPENITEFAAIKKVSRRSVYPFLHVNKSVSEQNMKKWIASIVGTNDVPKDWGGERSDLFLQVNINGQPMNAAFLLKGPAKFQELMINHLGKRGDQLIRLYDEPAELYVIVHCHKVSSAVRKNMEIFSSSFHRPTQYCIIDGYDALRLWKAYEKLPKSVFKR